MMTHKDLIVWQKGIELVKDVYEATKAFPQAEQFGLVSQIRRSAVSIPSNIAEGCGRNSDKELIHFLYIVLGSASELETQFIISLELNFIEKEKANLIMSQLNEVIRMTSSLIKSIKTRTEISTK
ncbi:four helix bundle protein [Paludibacter sp. 221]|uniref:four helix bundle protein n=1 Tax=Paludibacter sp. 221 TaxID=2302939 RepID=UPI0013D38E42|nr:four helix bundle protein [Paludibacter sp. 221]NDV47062.1 four helix bundle protein [Paludibacter sp. 221]